MVFLGKSMNLDMILAIYPSTFFFEFIFLKLKSNLSKYRILYVSFFFQCYGKAFLKIIYLYLQ